MTRDYATCRAFLFEVLCLPENRCKPGNDRSPEAEEACSRRRCCCRPYPSPPSRGQSCKRAHVHVDVGDDGEVEALGPNSIEYLLA